MSVEINIRDHVLFEDEYILVLHKPATLMVEPDRNGHPNLLHQVKRYVKLSTGNGEVYAQHIHRLDRVVSGVILFAKQRQVLKNLSEQFAERGVRKFYQALTVNVPPVKEGTLEHWLRKEKKKAVIYNEEVPFAERAMLHYKIEESVNGYFRWNIELHTGKYHQIRAQLSAMGCPIVGDVLYNSTHAYKADAIALHASKLIFHHPVTNREVVIEKASDF